jgi:lipopolysaccharide heptosyltransferase III
VTASHVLLARLDNVGDVLLTGPAVRAVAANARRVTYLTSTSGRAAAELLPGVDEVITYDAPWVGFAPPPTSTAQFERTVARLGEIGARQAFVFTSYHQSPLPLALMLRLAGVPTIAAASVDYPGSLLDVRHGAIVGHEVEQALSLVGTLGYALPAGDQGRLEVKGPLPRTAPFDEPYLVVHAGASVPARGIDVAVATALVGHLLDDGWCVALTGSAQEAATTRRIAAAHGGRIVDLAGTLELAGLAGVLAGAAAVVAGNTGPAHLAAAVGTPVVSVFAPVVPLERWAPWRVPTVVLGDQTVPCRGCRARSCPIPGQPCLRPVTGPALADAVRSLVGLPSDAALHPLARPVA